MAGRFPLFTDAHIQQPIVKGLTKRGWDVERAIDVFPERTSDDALFEHAVKTGRVFVTSDAGILAAVREWLSDGRDFKGMIYWKQVLYYQMSIGDFLRAFEEFAEEDNPFVEHIRFITRPPR